MKTLLVAGLGLSALRGLQELCSLLGITVISAAGGQEACSLSGSHFIDAALIDLRLPDMNASDIVRRIQTDHPSARLALLGNHDLPAHPHRLTAPSVAVLSRPLSFHDVLDLLTGPVRSPRAPHPFRRAAAPTLRPAFLPLRT